ncbi:MAG: hypothetical protein A3F84_12740 [Candidatus Handelsmanbacteria bacterium RIFCSPLOWO2_12_FULL_64_10]|uniref:Uncharacterized protein n=1 Tax=Handelsmanbacteria sp. (strain RIFCSPLOWO2_12_FULL_64_10) TaxID=1817868 RepID=A0A1F6CEX8_HANXR|nr:MAG: hypothetical protein A3F84_12740 [Candidatus Handelsmanbacteria bacterium RIFCSPLOWO2_12_FULL_64_10]
MRLFRRRKRPRRAVSRTERVIGGILLLLLPAIAGAVYVAGQRSDPGLFAFDPAGGAGRGRWVLPLPSPVEGWAPAGEVERFRADSLYVKIDGRAEQYIAYDVVGLEAVTLVDARQPGRLVEVFVYDMGEPANAFGVFSVERSPGTSVALGREGYRSRSSVFFYKGRYYAQVLPSEEGGEMERVATAVAGAVARRMEDREGSLWGLTAFPATGLTPNSAQYLKRDALSLDFLTDVYTARYAGEGGEVTAFLTRRRSEREAEEICGRYIAYLQRYGKVLSQGEAPGGVMAEGEVSGLYEAVFRKGEVFGGVTGAKGREAARARARALMDSL